MGMDLECDEDCFQQVFFKAQWEHPYLGIIFNCWTRGITISWTETASYSIRAGAQKMDTSPTLSIGEKWMVFPVEKKMHVVSFSSMMLGFLSTTLQETLNFVSCQHI